MKKMFRNAVTVAMALYVALLAVPAMAGGLTLNDVTGTKSGLGGGANDIASITGMGSQDPRDIASNVIKIVLGFLGILAVIIILIGGFKWMTAAGNEEGVEEAKKILIAGVIGLIIVLASWGIASFVLTNLITATQ